MVSFFGILVLLVLVGLVVGSIALAIFLATRNSGPDQGSNPNLFPSPDCGRLISVRAVICPGCGGPVQGK